LDNDLSARRHEPSAPEVLTMATTSESRRCGVFRSPATLALLAFLALAAYFLLTEHTGHLLGALPFLLVLACPLMHLFMMRGHGHGAEQHGEPASRVER
jgi:hypothetical protein